MYKTSRNNYLDFDSHLFESTVDPFVLFIFQHAIHIFILLFSAPLGAMHLIVRKHEFTYIALQC